MPRTKVLLFKNSAKAAPLRLWLNDLKQSEPAAYAKCLAAIRLLGQYGRELRRPTAAPLRDEIRELRTRVNTVRFRMLYFFCGKDIVCLSHGFAKKAAKVSDIEIDHAVAAKDLVKNDRDQYTVEWEL